VGDTILALPSSGVHSNGYSLVRRIVAQSGLGWDVPFAGGVPGATLGDALMMPTRIYVTELLALHRAGLLRAAAHITGGGLPGNLPRVLPDGLGATLQPWALPPVFRWLAQQGGVTANEMLRVFNCGVGMALVVTDPAAAQAVLGNTAFVLGHVTEGAGVHFTAPDDWLA